MTEQVKYSSRPGIIGCFMSVLLIVSFFLPRIWTNNSTVESFNTVLIVIILCIAVHLVRITSSQFYEHVWNNISFLILWCIPVAYLVITACRFIWDDLQFMTSAPFTVFLIFISLPSFCSYFFTVTLFHCNRDLRLVVPTVILDVISMIYVLLRLSDKVFIPVALSEGITVPDFVTEIVAFSSLFSLLTYIISFVNFIILVHIFGREKKNKKY